MREQKDERLKRKIHLINTMKKLFLIIILCLLTACDDAGYDYIDADDNGSGKIVRAPVKTDPNSSDVIKDSDGNIALEWLDTGLFVNSATSDAEGNITPPVIGLSVKGLWYPMGLAMNATTKECKLVSCSEANDSRCANLPLNTRVVKSYFGNTDCYLSNGLGIYLLIAKKGADNTFPNPNLNATTANDPNILPGCFSAHVGEFNVDKDGMIKVDKAWSCDYDDNNNLVCNAASMESLVGGKIYVKVVDSYYSDNYADRVDSSGNRYVALNIKTGIYYPNFVSAALGALKNTIEIVTKALKDSILASLKDIVFVVIVLYFAVTAFGFMTGLVKLTHTEATVRLLKLAIVIMLTSPGNLITDGFLKLYGAIAGLAADIAADALPNLPSTGMIDLGTDSLGNRIGYLGIYDGILNQILSIQVHIKIWSLLFTSRFWCIPLLYILLVITVNVVLRSILIYVTAYVQLSVLTLILPILAVMLLFRVTADLFQNWLKYMANSALLIIVATVGMGLVLSIMNENLGNLLNYSVTRKTLWWFLGWWFPDATAVSVQLTPTTYFSALIMALICYGFVEHVPKFADSLSDAQLSPTTSAFNSLWKGIQGMIDEGMQKAKNFNAQYGMGRILDQRYKTDGKYDASKEGKGALDKFKIARDKTNLFFYKNIGSKWDKIQQGMHDESLIKFGNQIDNNIKSKELGLLRAENAKEGITVKSYEKLIAEKQKLFTDELTRIDGLKDTVKIGDHQVSIADDGVQHVAINGQQIQKADIRNAMANNGTINIGGNDLRPESAYDQRLRESMENKLKDLGDIEKELLKVKRGS